MNLSEVIAQLTEERDELNLLIAGLTKRYVRSAAAEAPHPEATAAAPPRTPKTVTNGSVSCDKCGAEDFPHRRAMAIHRRRCDGVRRTPAERKKAAMERYLGKKQKKNTGKPQPREGRMPLPMRAPVPTQVETRLKCPSCPDTFPNAKELGLHETRVHFADRSLSRSPLGVVNG